MVIWLNEYRWYWFAALLFFGGGALELLYNILAAIMLMKHIMKLDFKRWAFNAIHWKPFKTCIKEQITCLNTWVTLEAASGHIDCWPAEELVYRTSVVKPIKRSLLEAADHQYVYFCFLCFCFLELLVISTVQLLASECCLSVMALWWKVQSRNCPVVL